MSSNRLLSTVFASVAAALVAGFSSVGSTVVVAGAGLVFSAPAQALSCGSYDGKVCSGASNQYGGGFNPGVGYGGFGGAYNCTASHTPVVFIHGNGDSAPSWDVPTSQVPGYAKAPRSIYDEFKARGYKDCELFGVTYLSSSERQTLAAGFNYHQPSKYNIILSFIDKVKQYTGKSKVDIVTHSLGVSMSLAALTYGNKWGSVERFVSISGGMRGLNSCYYTGYANPYAPSCGSENIYNKYIFGFFPEGWYGWAYVPNRWTGNSSTWGMRNAPRNHAGVRFYSITAMYHDEIACATTVYYSNCAATTLFNSSSNVKAQLNVGAGSTAASVDWDWSDGLPVSVMGGDTDGVGHLRARDNTGRILYNMLTSSCTGTSCASGYSYGPVSEE